MPSLNIVIIFRFLGGIIERITIIIGNIGVLLVVNIVDRCPYRVGNCYFTWDINKVIIIIIINIIITGTNDHWEHTKSCIWVLKW